MIALVMFPCIPLPDIVVQVIFILYTLVVNIYLLRWILSKSKKQWKCDNKEAEHYCHVFTFYHQACMLYEEKYPNA